MNKEFIKYNWWRFFKVVEAQFFITLNNYFGSFYCDYTLLLHCAMGYNL